MIKRYLCRNDTRRRACLIRMVDGSRTVIEPFDSISVKNPTHKRQKTERKGSVLSQRRQKRQGVISPMKPQDQAAVSAKRARTVTKIAPGHSRCPPSKGLSDIDLPHLRLNDVHLSLTFGETRASSSATDPWSSQYHNLITRINGLAAH